MMTDAALASQQLLTAWVSAGASVVQAVGAVGAIIAAVVLARSSEQRASNAEAKADRRALDAERESVRRAEAAERRADERALAAEIKEWDRVVEPILMQLHATATDLRATISHWEQGFQSTPSSKNQTVYGSGSVPAQSLKKAASDAISRAPARELAALLVRIDLAVAQYEPDEAKSDRAEPWVAARGASLTAFTGLEKELQELRQAFADQAGTLRQPSE